MECPDWKRYQVFVAGAAMLDKGPDWSQGARGNEKSLLRVMNSFGPGRSQHHSLVR